MSNLNLAIIAILILTVYYLLQDTELVQLGGSALPVTLPESGQSPYNRQYRELDNVDNVLNRPLHSADKVTAGLHAANTWENVDGTRRSNLELIKPNKHYLDFNDIDADLVSPDTRALVESKQHYFLDEAKIIDYYGKKFYWDWRYPKEPLPIEFAHNPEKWVRENPNLYPSYIVRSRDYSQLEN